MTANDREWLELAWAQLWQVTALVVVVGALTRFGCRRRPHLAYVLWMLVMFKCLAPPLWSSATGLFSWAQVRMELPAPQMPIPALNACQAIMRVVYSTCWSRSARGGRCWQCRASAPWKSPPDDWRTL